MVTINGVRHRPEDVERLGLKPIAARRPVVDAQPESDESGVEAFDPRGRTVEEVLTELQRVASDADEVARIQELEDAGKGRVTITEWQPS